MLLAPSLDTIGILARSARDIAQVFPVVSALPLDDRRVASRAAVIEGALAECDPNIVALFRDAVSDMADLGVAIVSRPGFPHSADRASLLVMQAEAARSHRDLIARGRLDSILVRRLSKGLTISDQDLAATLLRRGATCDEFVSQFLDDAEVALLPVMPAITPRYAETDPSSSGFKASRLYALSQFTRFVNYLGLPALALPMGVDRHGMPTAFQLVGRPGSEALLIELGRRFQEATGWHGRLPDGVTMQFPRNSER